MREPSLGRVAFGNWRQAGTLRRRNTLLTQLPLRSYSVDRQLGHMLLEFLFLVRYLEFFLVHLGLALNSVLQALVVPLVP